jgi:hypothetical protein
MITVIHPTFEDYRSRVSWMAQKYNCESWFELSAKSMSGEDRFEYSFIISTFGDRLIHREFEEMSRTPDLVGMACERSTEPGMLPGSVVYRGVMIGCPQVCGTH